MPLVRRADSVLVVVDAQPGLHTVDRALETFPEAAALGTPPWRL